MTTAEPPPPPPLNYDRPDPPPPGAPTLRSAISHCVTMGLLAFPTLALAAFYTAATIRGTLEDDSPLSYAAAWGMILFLWSLSAFLLYFTWRYFRAITHHPRRNS